MSCYRKWEWGKEARRSRDIVGGRREVFIWSVVKRSGCHCISFSWSDEMSDRA